jgi:hypothetical protein
MGSTEVREGSGEAVVDIAAWLRRLGLEQYEQAFRDNNIDAEVLPELTAEDGLVTTGDGRSDHDAQFSGTNNAVRQFCPSQSRW